MTFFQRVVTDLLSQNAWSINNTRMVARDLFHTFPDIPHEPEILEDLLDLICKKEEENKQAISERDDEISDVYNRNEGLEDDLYLLEKEAEGLREELKKLKQIASDDWWVIWGREEG